MIDKHSEAKGMRNEKTFIFIVATENKSNCAGRHIGFSLFSYTVLVEQHCPNDKTELLSSINFIAVHSHLHCVFQDKKCGYQLREICENRSRIHELEVSGHNLESFQTLSFCMDFLNHMEGGMVFYQVFLLSPLQCTVTEL
jgi:hypothetical protein